MKRNLKIIIGASTASILAFSALAQDTPNPTTDHADRVRNGTLRNSADRLNGAAKATDIIGLVVKNQSDEKLGKVDDLAVDVESGRIVEVIVATGRSSLGYGDTTVAVPPGAFDYDATRETLALDAETAKWKAAPRFDATRWDEGTSSNRVLDVYAYYGRRPYFVADPAGFGTINADGKLAESLPRNLDGTINTDAARTVDKARNVEAARNLEHNNDTTVTRNPDGTLTRTYYPNGEGMKNSWSRLGYVLKGSKLIGVPIRNLQDEKLGKVENFAVDLASGRIVAVIISSGGFLGMGDQLSVVPPTVLRFNATHDTLQLDTSKAMLAASPRFTSKDWARLSHTEYTTGIYRAYKVDPYFTTGIDEARRSVRRLDGQALTPLDQGSSKADLDTTTRIRKEIIAGKDLSSNAQNVKVITINGQVTLRGLVNTAEEKRRVGEIAEGIAQPENVHNQLDVKLTTSSN